MGMGCTIASNGFFWELAAFASSFYASKDREGDLVFARIPVLGDEIARVTG